jgi:hypothetical protein
MILAIVGWKILPSVSLVALITFVILFLLELVALIIVARNGLNRSRPGVAFLEALIRAGAWGLVLVALFGRRNQLICEPLVEFQRAKYGSKK